MKENWKKTIGQERVEQTGVCPSAPYHIDMPTTVCICGGGNLGHSIAGRAAAVMEGKGEVRLLTRKPERWSNTIRVEDDLGHTFATPLAMVTDNAQKAVCHADVVLLCLPGFAIQEELEKIKPYLTEHTLVGSVVCSTGFFFDAFSVLGKQAPLFGFQRVPFVARIENYGSHSYIWGYRKEVFMAVCNTGPERTAWLRRLFEDIFGTPVSLLENYMEAALTNSNPILHTGCLYSMWGNWDGKPFGRQSYFYREWTEKASETVMAMDREFFRLTEALGMRKGAIKPLLEHYESTDAASMTAKIRSIPSLNKVLSPMKQVEGGYVPDFQSRYFTEDFPYGLAIIQKLARQHGVSTPVIDAVMEWGMALLQSQ